MNREFITVELSKDEALVLLEWLAQFDKAGAETFKHPAEEKVVWKIEGVLEKALVELFDPEYKRLLAEARNRVHGDAK